MNESCPLHKGNTTAAEQLSELHRRVHGATRADRHRASPTSKDRGRGSAARRRGRIPRPPLRRHCESPSPDALARGENEEDPGLDYGSRQGRERDRRSKASARRLILDEASARGSPCKCTLLSPAAYLTPAPHFFNGLGGQVGLGGGRASAGGTPSGPRGACVGGWDQEGATGPDRDFVRSVVGVAARAAPRE